MNIKIKSPEKIKTKYQSVKVGQLQEGDLEEKAAIINTNRSEMFTDSLQSSPLGRDFLSPKQRTSNNLVLELDGNDVKSMSSSRSPRSGIRSDLGSPRSGDNLKVQFKDEVEEVHHMSGVPMTSVRQLTGEPDGEKSKFIKTSLKNAVPQGINE